MMLILYLLCFILKCHVSLFVSPILNEWFLGILCHNFLKHSKHYITFYFQYRYTPTFEVTQFLLHKRSKHWTAEQYQGSDDRGELDLKSDLNRPASGKLQQSTTVSSQFERFS